MTTSIGGGGRRRGALAAGLVIVATAALAGCGASSSSASAASATGATVGGGSAVSLATSLSTGEESWAIVPVSANPVFWEVLVRPAGSARWQLVTPPGVADNGGLVAAADAGSGLTVAVRPSQDLAFTPVASTADAGATWSTDGPISTGVAASPGALARSDGQLAALLANGRIEASSDAGTTWKELPKPGASATSASGQPCGALRVASVSFGPIPNQVLAAGDCTATGAAGLFAYSATSTGSGSSTDRWQRVTLPVSGPLVRLDPGTALVRGKAGLTALWPSGFGWYAYAPLSSPAPVPSAGWTASVPLPVTSAVTASGELAEAAHRPDGTWVLLQGGQAATISGPGQPWLLLPPVPARTSVLASGPGNSIEALAVSGSTLTVWRLDHGSTVWARAQTIIVPLQLGSSN